MIEVIEVIEVLVAVVLMTTLWLWSALRFGSDFILLPDGSPVCRAADTGRDHFLTWAPAHRAALVARGHAVGDDDSAPADLDDTLGQTLKRNDHAGFLLLVVGVD